MPLRSLLGRPLIALGVLIFAAALPAFADDTVPHGSPSAAGGTCCSSLAEVRTHIDAIDTQILKLMAERQTYVHEAGRFKPSVAKVQDDKRVAAIIAKVRAEATTLGLSPDVAEATFRAMIAAFTEEEKKQVGARTP